jgi:glutamyl/glutaminyl-tRNA synthetase
LTCNRLLRAERDLVAFDVHGADDEIRRRSGSLQRPNRRAHTRAKVFGNHEQLLLRFSHFTQTSDKRPFIEQDWIRGFAHIEQQNARARRPRVFKMLDFAIFWADHDQTITHHADPIRSARELDAVV